MEIWKGMKAMDNLFLEYIERFENIDWLKKHITKYSIIELKNLYGECSMHGLLESSIHILREMCQKAKDEEEINTVIKLLDSEIFLHGFTDEIKKYFLKVIQPAVQNDDNSKRILFHLYGWLYGGAERAVSRVVNELCTDYDIFLIVFSPVNNDSFFLDNRIKFLEIKQEFNNVRRLYKLVRILEPKVFVGNNNSIPEFLTIYDWLSSQNIKTIAYCHEFFFYMHQNTILCKRVLEKNYYLNKANAVVFLTSFSSNAYALINDNGARIPNPLSFDIECKDAFKNIQNNSKNIIAVGRYFDYIKRVDLLLETYAEVLKSEPDAKLTIIGKYDLDLFLPEKACSVQALMKKLSLSDENVHFVGNQKDVSKWYQQGDILVMTSDNEGFGMVLIEAGAFGVPCVVFDIPGLDDIIKNGKNGFIVSRDVKEMAGKIVYLLKNSAIREEMSNAAVQYAKRYEIKTIGAMWRELLECISLNDNQHSLNLFLKNHFQPQIENPDDFSRKIIKEYDNCLINIIDN